MSSQRFNFNDQVADAFPFSVGGRDYDMRYPTQDEMKPFSKMLVEFNEMSQQLKIGQGDEKAYLKLNDKMEDFIYGLIVPVGHETPIKETLKEVNVVVLRRLNSRLVEELLS